MRIHIGQISEALASDLGMLEKQLQKYGALQSAIELRQKPALDNYYAYVDVDLDQKGYSALRSGLNGVTFRQSKLTVQEARPDYAAVLQKRREAPEPGPNPEQLKRQRSKRHGDNEYTGRHRTAPRAEGGKPTTFRITMPGADHPIKPRMKKIRLWGYEKRKTENLVHEFVDGEWRDLLGSAVEIAGADEQERNARLAEQIVAPGVLSDSEFEEFRAGVTRLPDEEFEDDGIEIVSREANQFTAYPNDEDSEDDWPAEPAAEDAQDVEIQDADEENTTEALRSVLSVQKPFTLFGEADAVEQEPVIVEPVVRRGRFGLFFAHSDSPFLRSQAQATKIAKPFDSEAWDKLFWEKRGEFNRTLRRRRKEVGRQMRKKHN